MSSRDGVSLRDLYSAIERLEAKIDERVTDNAKRIDNLETFRDRWAGGITVLSAAIGFFSGWIRERLFG